MRAGVALVCAGVAVEGGGVAERQGVVGESWPGASGWLVWSSSPSLKGLNVQGLGVVPQEYSVSLLNEQSRMSVLRS